MARPRAVGAALLFALLIATAEGFSPYYGAENEEDFFGPVRRMMGEEAKLIVSPEICKYNLNKHIFVEFGMFLVQVFSLRSEEGGI